MCEYRCIGMGCKKKNTNHNVSYWWSLSGNCVFVLLYGMELNCWKGNCLWGFRNFRLPCESKPAIFQGTLTPFALFPYCSKGLPGKCIWFKESGGGVSEELSCKGKPHKIVLRIFFPPHSRGIQSLTRSRFLFFLCHISQRSLWPQGVFMWQCDLLYLYSRLTTILALIIVQSLKWKWFVAGWWSPSPVVEQRWWIMRRGRQLPTWIHPQSELYSSEIHFQVWRCWKSRQPHWPGTGSLFSRINWRKK